MRAVLALPALFASIMAPIIAPTAALAARDAGYRSEIEQWRKGREERLRKEGGWLSLVGLFWLKQGENSVGRGASRQVRLPKGAADTVGLFELLGSTVRFTPQKGVIVTLNGKPLHESAIIRSDEKGQPDLLQHGRFEMLLIRRSSGLGVRVKDPESPARKSFRGLSWFPIDEKYRIEAEFVPYDPPQTLRVPNILGGADESKSPGRVRFSWDGKAVEMVAIEEEGELFFAFKDGTNGKGTYPAGRFLYAGSPKNGRVVLDFNKAFTPPCAFSAYATCPLPLRSNFLKISVPAGEKHAGHGARH